MAKFKKGDTVRCVDALDWMKNYGLQTEHCYTVTGYRIADGLGDEPEIYINSTYGGSWKESRFELIESAQAPTPAPALTGGKVNYYLARVEKPQREEQAPYQAECEDIIQALGMDFNEGCLFKELWRSAAARKGNGKPGHTAKYGAEKMVHYANRILKNVS